MSAASWPYSPAQCPNCLYFRRFAPPLLDEDGSETVGLCRHPRIGMELFILRHRQAPHCPLYFPAGVSTHR